MKEKSKKDERNKNPVAVALASMRWPGHVPGPSQPRRLRCDTIDRINVYQKLNGLDLFDRALNSALDRAELLQPGQARFDPERGEGGRRNGRRALDAGGAVAGYAASLGLDGKERPSECPARDLIADLGHWCDREGVDFAAEVAAGLRNWRAER